MAGLGEQADDGERLGPHRLPGAARGGTFGVPPEPLTSLVGREQDVATVAALVADHRLVTVTGPGGAGKTRLALAAANALRSGLPGRIRWVDLTAVGGSEQLALAVADAVGVREAPYSSLIGALLHHLRGARMLLVLDNGEHVVAALADLVEALLAGCPQLHVLVTSREMLGLASERRWPVPLLPVPDPAALPRLAALAELPAIRLFVERATAVDPSFALTDQNAAAVAAACARLDGLPLAIELAAGRVAAVPVERVAIRLDDSARLLAGSRRGGASRQRTLRASMDWSHDLLPASEQRLFRRLAAFAGSFGLDDAEAVCASDRTTSAWTASDRTAGDRTASDRTAGAGSGDDGSGGDGSGDDLGADEVLPLLSRLVEKSLVQLCRKHGHGRYRLLQTVRVYAEHRLVESGEADHVRRRHEPRILAVPQPGRPPTAVAQPAPAAPALRVYGLGPVHEYRGEHLLGPADWTYQKPRELLHYLLSQQACTKEQIGLALWPEADAETLRNSFHTTLRHLRRALGRADWVVFHAGRYRLNRSLDYRHDVEQFEAGLAAARAAGSPATAVRLLAAAVAHYRGDFLADGPPGGGWVEARRDDLRRQAEAALLTLGDLLRAQGEPGRAADAYRRLLAVDGLLEVAHRQLMQCYAELGERGRALRQYAELVDLLAGELGVAPAPETTALYHRLRRALPVAV
jgi:predicted ATPase/DNA-binding SARP family transcriptional activator